MTLCRQVLSQLHEAHQGSIWTKQQTYLTVYWPGKDHGVDQMISNVRTAYISAQLKEPIIFKPGHFRRLQLTSDTMRVLSHCGQPHKLAKWQYGKGHHSQSHVCWAHRTV